MRKFLLSFAGAFWPGAAAAAAMNRPFAVGGFEGGGGAEGGVTGWLLNMQSVLTHMMSGKLHALSQDGSAFWSLVGLGLAYGVFHAAGPGHGKAVIASYMLANGRAVKRGAVVALFAALLQGMVAVALVGVAALIFRATAEQMNAVADTLAYASYAGIAVIGAWLALRKGRSLVAALRRYFALRAVTAGGILFANAPWQAAAPALSGGSFSAYEPGSGVRSEEDCGHDHAPNPAMLREGFTWRGAVGAVVAAGMRPCSGAILVLVFSLAQGVFLAGIAATFAMSIGTAVTTGALAFAAVFAKDFALRYAGADNARAAVIARAFEFAAALTVLGFGVALLLAARGGA